MTKATYGRGQVEWALWRTFTRHSVGAATKMPTVFRTRIKRLMEVDRGFDFSVTEAPPERNFAFAPFPDETGEVAYGAVDAFCIAVALDLLDAGFKQAEVVFLMRYLRPELEERFGALLSLPSLNSRQRYQAKSHPDLPVYRTNGKDYADGRLFIVLQKVEMTEIVSKAALTRDRVPIFLEPIYCHGIVTLTEALDDLMPNRRRGVTVLELAANAQAVSVWLKEAPVIQRGRPKKSA